jgi:PAS domain S-box-containing protein
VAAIDEKGCLEFARDIVRALGADGIPEVLQACVQAVVDHLDAAFSRIWTASLTGPGWELQASARSNMRSADVHTHMPVPGLMEYLAVERRRYVTNDLIGDPRLGDQGWAVREGLTAFAGQPLVYGGKLLGAWSMFSRRPVSDLAIDVMTISAGSIAATVARRNAEAAAASASQRSQLVIESVPTGILVVDSAGRITLANAHAQEMLGFGREELIGRPVESLVPEPLRGTHRDHRRAFHLAPRGRAGSGREMVAVRRDGTEFSAEIGLNPIDFDGETAVLCSIMDITERKLAERRIVEASRMKSEFLANMSHEIRTPMNVLVGMSRLLLDTSLTDDQRDLAETIRKGADSLLVVINDSLDFSRIEAGKLEIDPADFVVDSIPEDVAAMLSQQASGKGLQLTCFVAPDAPHYLFGDAGRVRQVLTNLVANAIKFTAQGTVDIRVHVGEQKEDRTVLRFEVDDTGIGISPEAHERIFQPFTQEDGSTTRRFGGTGLGLTISRRLVELMGGSIGVNSQPGKGATFWFEIPFENARGMSEHGPDAPSALAGLRVLIVDSETANADQLSAQMESLQIQPQRADNALAAVTMIREAHAERRPYGAVVLDYGMSGMNGTDIARVVRADLNLASTPMIMSVSQARRIEAQEAREVGITVYLGRPARQHQIRHALATALRQSPDSAGVRTAAKLAVLRRGVTILLVEDNIDNQRLAVRLLHKFGYDCAVASNAGQALTMMAASVYPLVLMDCQMPDMDGFQATAAIRQREGGKRRTPIIGLTALALRGDRERCLKAGMDDYVTKPIDEEVLLRKIARWAPDAESCAPDPEPVRVRAPAGMADLIPEYLANCRQNLVDLEADVATGDWKAVRAIGHNLKGCGQGYGFSGITEIGRGLELAAEEENTEGITRQIVRLQSYLSRLEVTYP